MKPLEELLEAAARAQPQGEQAMKARVWARLQRPPGGRGPLLAVAVAAVGLAVMVLLPRDEVVRGDRYERGGVHATLAQGCILHTRPLRLERGAATFEVTELTRLAAGAAFVEASSASFVADVQARRVTVRVERGSVRVDGVPLQPGDSWSSDGGKVARFVPPDDAELDRRARDSSPDEAASIYAQIAAGNGPRAGNALYELAVLRLRKLGEPAAALEAIDDYRRRFPDGPLAQEASLTAIEALLKLGEQDRAAREMDDFLARYPQSERAAEVRRLRAESR